MSTTSSTSSTDAPPRFEYLVKGNPRSAIISACISVAAVVVLIVACRAHLLWPVAIPLLLWSSLRAIRREQRGADTVFAYFRAWSDRLEWKTARGDTVGLPFAEIIEITIYAGMEWDTIVVDRHEGPRRELCSGDLRNEHIHPICEYLYENFPGRVVDLRSRKRPSGTLEQRQGGTAHGAA